VPVDDLGAKGAISNEVAPPSLSDGAAERAQRWLITQCGMISQARRGAVFVRDQDTGTVGSLCHHPEDLPLPPDPRFQTPLAAGETQQLRAGDRGTFLLREIPATAQSPALLVVLELGPCDEQAREVIGNLLAWGMEWLSYSIRQAEPEHRGVLSKVFPLVAVCLDQPDLQSLSTTLVTELAQRFDCQRVSLGLRKQRQTDLIALSHSARVQQDANLLRSIRLAMDEAIDQDRAISFSGNSDNACGLDYAHTTLAGATGDACILTLPLAQHGRTIGALVLERKANRPFQAESVEILERALAVLSPVLRLMQHDEMGLLPRAGRSLGEFSSKLLGPSHYALKLGMLAVFCTILFLSVARGDWRVTANALVEGQVQRTIAAPIDGFIQTAEARAGDLIGEGALLGTLDDSDLKLERLKWATLRQQMVSESREAMAQRDRAEVSIIGARIEQADAELRLLDEQLARTRIVAPFAGVIIEGDLSQRLGTPVSRGDALFVIAPLQNFRIVLMVDERDIPPVQVGQAGALVLASMPDRKLPLRIERISSVSTAGDGRNQFRVEASLTNAVDGLRPGMEGVGKIDLGEARLAWIWSRKLLGWLRLTLWTWWR